MTISTLTSAELADVLSRAQSRSLSTSSLQALCHLHSEPGGLTMGQLAKRIGTSTAAVTGMIDRLDAASLTYRNHSQFDRRCIWIHLTPSGRDAVESILCPP